MTVVFCDVVGSTALGESLDPEALRALMARSFERMNAIVEAHGGTARADRRCGRGGVRGAGRARGRRAARAAGRRRDADALPELGVEARLGVNTGEVVTGPDDAVVTGRRSTSPPGCSRRRERARSWSGADTVALARGAVGVEELEPLELKGKAEPVAAFRLLAVGEPPERSHRSRVCWTGPRARAPAGGLGAGARRSGRCELVTVVGEPGVGKSRLAAELVADLDATVVTGRCLSYGEGIGYRPVVQVITQLGARPRTRLAAGILTR